MKAVKTTYLLVILAAVAILFLVGMSGVTKEGFAASGAAAGANTLTLYYADWCPHCKAVKPVFETLKSESPLKVKGKMVFIEMAEADKDAEKIKAAGIKGFPTIKLQNESGSITEFDGERTDAGIRSWLSQNL
jgi:thiol-disulfide isomerase/thioredoxin